MTYQTLDPSLSVTIPFRSVQGNLRIQVFAIKHKLSVDTVERMLRLKEECKQ